MSLSYTGRLITDGLVLHLDAGDVNSYPKSGTTWYDLSGNNNHCYAAGNPTFDGVGFVFDGDGDYFYSTTSTNLQDIEYPTVLAICKPTTISRRHYVFDSRYNNPGVNLNGMGMGFDSNGTPFNFIRITGYDEASGPTGFVTGNTYMLGLQRSGSGDTIQIIDTDNQTLISPTLSIDTLESTGSTRVGGYIVGNYANPSNTYTFVGSIYKIMGYNRQLSQTEITQIYNVLKARFNL